MFRSQKRLPDAEFAVMQAIWDCTPPVTRAELEKQLEEYHPMATTTLLTLLTRLAERGYISVEKHGRGNCYTPIVARRAYLSSQGSQFFRSLCGGNVSLFANALCDSGLTKEELAQLRQLLEEGDL